MKMSRWAIFAITLVGLTNCASLKPRPDVTGSFVRLGGTPSAKAVVDPAKVNVDTVEVFYKKEITVPHTELGIVEAVARGSTAGLGELIPELQRQAALLGARAIKKIEIQRYDHAGPAIHATALAVDFK